MKAVKRAVGKIKSVKARRHPPKMQPDGKVWSGRFDSRPAELMERFSHSIPVDRVFWQEDLAVNRAWAKALRTAGILSAQEESKIVKALKRIEEEFQRDRFVIQPGDEDIHVAIERRLTEIARDTGAKIHTGRSRNDQVVTDFRLYLKRRVQELRSGICAIVEAVIAQAEGNLDVIMPGYTHAQQAQAVRLSHYLLSAFFALRRHYGQLDQFSQRVDELPLGCGALAGTAFAIDREMLAKELGFSRVMENSIDATGTRSFCSEIVFLCADLCTTLSRYCNDAITWCSQEYGFLDPGEQFATGSSMMPNKKNPDAFELVRGKAGILIGLTSAIMAMQKGLTVTYSRDLQEDKKVVFEALQTAADCLQVFAGALATCRFRTDRMEAALNSGLYATDIADYLVRKGMPFRQAHNIVAVAVRHAEKISYKLDQLPLSFWLALHPIFDKEVMACFSAETSVEKRNAIGGTASSEVLKQIKLAKEWLEIHGRR